MKIADQTFRAKQDDIWVYFTMDTYPSNIDKETIGMSTGHKDMNGHDIFEGDLLSYWSEHQGIKTCLGSYEKEYGRSAFTPNILEAKLRKGDGIAIFLIGYDFPYSKFLKIEGTIYNTTKQAIIDKLKR